MEKQVLKILKKYAFNQMTFDSDLDVLLSDGEKNKFSNFYMDNGEVLAYVSHVILTEFIQKNDVSSQDIAIAKTIIASFLGVFIASNLEMSKPLQLNDDDVK